MNKTDKSPLKEFTSAAMAAKGIEHPVSVRMLENDKGEPMLETTHNLTCTAGVRVVECPITITTPVDAAIYYDLKLQKREILAHSRIALDSQKIEQDKINEYLNANGNAAPQGTTAINLAIKVAKENRLDIADNKAIVRAITSPPAPTMAEFRRS